MIAWLLPLVRSPVTWAAAAVVAGYLYGTHIGKERCEADIAEAIAEMRERHAQEVERILEDVSRQIAEAEAEIDALQTEVTAYEQEIAGRADVCLLGADDAERLRNIK